MPTWPATLPDVQRKFNQAPIYGALRSSFISKRSRQRERYTTPIFNNTVQWLFTGAQYQLFQSFVRYTLDKGTADFTVDLPFGNGLESVTARFNGGYSGTYKTPHWEVTANLEVVNPPHMDEETFDLFEVNDFDLADIEGAANHLHVFVHVQYPAMFG